MSQQKHLCLVKKPFLDFRDRDTMSCAFLESVSDFPMPGNYATLNIDFRK